MDCSYNDTLNLTPFRPLSNFSLIFSLLDTYPLDSVVYKWREPGVITRSLVHQINQYTLRIERFNYNSTKYNDKGTNVYFEWLQTQSSY